MNNGFLVTVGAFEGPLDLLLSLIEERRMLISDVSLADVADDFLSFVKNAPTFPAGEAAEFLLIAATLILIKSRSLLPVLSLSDEEEQNTHDLERRLALLKIIREAGKKIAALTGRLYFGGLKRDTAVLFAPAPDVSLEALRAAADETLRRAPLEHKKPEVSVASIISLDEMMVRLSERIERALSTTFSEFVGSPEDKREVVVGFLALLELVKQGLVSAEQRERFADISMSYAGVPNAPRYD